MHDIEVPTASIVEQTRPSGSHGLLGFVVLLAAAAFRIIDGASTVANAAASANG